MPTTPIPRSNINRAIEFCLTNIGPKRYHLHNQIGGDGWAVHIGAGRIDLRPEVRIDDEDFSLLFTLSIDYS